MSDQPRRSVACPMKSYAANAAKLRNMRLRGEYGRLKENKMSDDKYYSKQNSARSFCWCNAPRRSGTEANRPH